MTPAVNTWIVPISDGSGQVGAGVARAPIECFRQALLDPRPPAVLSLGAVKSSAKARRSLRRAELPAVERLQYLRSAIDDEFGTLDVSHGAAGNELHV